MADERITVEVVAKDMASGVFHGVASALGQVATIAAGILSARTFEKIASAIWDTGKAAAEAYEWYDRVRFSLINLALADEYATGNLLSFSNMMRNASERGAELLQWVKELALASPFSMEDVNKMFRLVRAYGFTSEEAKKLTAITIDYAAATGFGAQVLERLGLALGQVRQRGRLAGEEIRQLINTGIPVRDILAEAFGKTTAEIEKMIRKGLIPGGRAVEEIMKWMERFEGAGERAVKSWFGMVVNLKDIKDLNMIAVFDGIAQSLLPGLQSVFDLMSSDAFLANMSQFGTAIGEWISGMLPAFQTFLFNLQGVITALSEGGPGSEQFLTAISNLTGFDFVGLAAGLSNIGDAIGVVQTNLALMGVTPDTLSSFLTNVGTALGTISVVVMDAVAWFLDRFSTHAAALSNIGYPVFMDGWNQTMRELFMIWGAGGSENAVGIVEFLLRISATSIGIGLGFVATMFGTLVDVIHGAPGEDILARWQAWIDMSEKMTLYGVGAIGAPEGPPANPNAPTKNPPMWATPPPVGLPQDMLDATKYPTEEEKQKFVEGYTDVGKAAARGLYSGWQKELAGVRAAIQQDLLNLKKLADQLYAIQSPSGLFAEVGEQMAAGLAQGFHQEVAGSRMGYAGDLRVAGAKNVYMGGVNIQDKYDLQSFTRALYQVLGG